MIRRKGGVVFYGLCRSQRAGSSWLPGRTLRDRRGCPRSGTVFRRCPSSLVVLLLLFLSQVEVTILICDPQAWAALQLLLEVGRFKSDCLEPVNPWSLVSIVTEPHCPLVVQMITFYTTPWFQHHLESGRRNWAFEYLQNHLKMCLQIKSMYFVCFSSLSISLINRFPNLLILSHSFHHPSSFKTTFCLN